MLGCPKSPVPVPNAAAVLVLAAVPKRLPVWVGWAAPNKPWEGQATLRQRPFAKDPRAGKRDQEKPPQEPTLLGLEPIQLNWAEAKLKKDLWNNRVGRDLGGLLVQLPA